MSPGGPRGIPSRGIGQKVSWGSPVVGAASERLIGALVLLNFTEVRRHNWTQHKIAENANRIHFLCIPSPRQGADPPKTSKRNPTEPQGSPRCPRLSSSHATHAPNTPKKHCPIHEAAQLTSHPATQLPSTRRTCEKYSNPESK